MYVNRLVKQFAEMQKMMKKMPGMLRGKRGFGGLNLNSLMKNLKF